MKRGIFRYGPFKTFLTQAFPRNIFKPLLYTTADYIHDDFSGVLLDFFNRSKEISLQKFDILMFWFVLVPKWFFETIFIEDEKGGVYLNIVSNATQNNGKECAYITQGWVLWNLQQILQNKEEFRETMGFYIEDLENITKKILGNKNKTIHYLNYFREKFDLSKIGQADFIDPRDWGDLYVAEICKQLINDRELLIKILQPWENNLVKKLEFTNFISQFFLDKKNEAMKLAKK